MMPANFCNGHFGFEMRSANFCNGHFRFEMVSANYCIGRFRFGMSSANFCNGRFGFEMRSAKFCNGRFEFKIQSAQLCRRRLQKKNSRWQSGKQKIVSGTAAEIHAGKENRCRKNPCMPESIFYLCTFSPPSVCKFTRSPVQKLHRQ